MIWNIIGYLLLPFVAIYWWIKGCKKDMSDNQRFWFNVMLVITAMLLFEFVTNLL